MSTGTCGHHGWDMKYEDATSIQLATIMDGPKHPTMHRRVALFKNLWAHPANHGGCRTLSHQTRFPNSWYFLVCLHTVTRQSSFLSSTPHSPTIFLLVLSNKCRVFECAYPRVLKCRILHGHKRPTWGSGSTFYHLMPMGIKNTGSHGSMQGSPGFIKNYYRKLRSWWGKKITETFESGRHFQERRKLSNSFWGNMEEIGQNLR